VLSGVPSSLPAMVKANRIQEKVRGVGFDWEKPEQIWDKVLEEITELKKEIGNLNKENIESELGDVLSRLINASRLYGIDRKPLWRKPTGNSSNGSITWRRKLSQKAVHSTT